MYVTIVPSVQYKQLEAMARVSRATSATSSKTRAEAREAIRNSMATQVSEYSITTLRSEQEQEEGVTCWEWCLNGKMDLWAMVFEW